jgi:hypothetical protein
LKQRKGDDKMNHMLIDLWNGQLAPIEEAHDNEEMRQLMGLININYEKVQSILNQEQQERLEKYCACLHEYASLFAEQAFCSGFRLAWQLFAESWPYK